MKNNSESTKSSTNITESGNNALIGLPENGYYDTNSKISVPIETNIVSDKVTNIVLTNGKFTSDCNHIIIVVSATNTVGTGVSITVSGFSLSEITNYTYQENTTSSSRKTFIRIYEAFNVKSGNAIGFFAFYEGTYRILAVKY